MSNEHTLPSVEDLVALALRYGHRGVDAVRAHTDLSRDKFREYAQEIDLSEALKVAWRLHDNGVGLEDAPTPVDDPQRIKLSQQAAEIKELKREAREYEKVLVGRHELLQRIVETVRVPVTVPKFKVAKMPGKKPVRTIVAPIYDCQYGQHVRIEDVPGGHGEFNTHIFDQRLQRYVEGVTGNVRNYAAAHHVEELIIPLGGDQVEGDEIFAGQTWQLELDPVQQVIQLAAKLEGALDTILRFAKEEIGVERVGVYCVPGNHGKVGGRKSGARPSGYSWDVLLFEMLKDKLRSHPIDQFAIEPAGHLLFEAAGFNFLMIHGDEVKGWGGIPFYGLTKFDGRVQRLHNVRPDYVLLGHHHQAAEIPNGAGEYIVSGAWVGSSQLSRQLTSSTRPSQRLLFVARKWGVTETARIWFDHASEAYAPTKVYRTAA